MSDLTPKGFSNGQYVDRYLLRDKLYAEDAITMKGVAILNNFPAADVVEVVRCRECKHSIMHKFPYNYEKVLACNDPHGVTIRAVKPMHFCSYGERKDGGQEPPKEET